MEFQLQNIACCVCIVCSWNPKQVSVLDAAGLVLLTQKAFQQSGQRSHSLAQEMFLPPEEWSLDTQEFNKEFTFM